MSPSRNQTTPAHERTSLSAVWHPLLGLKPCECSENFGSSISSMTILRACWMILSRGELIPSGLILPFFLGINALRAGLNSYVSRRRRCEVLVNHARLIPSSVRLSVPFTMLPDLDLNDS